MTVLFGSSPSDNQVLLLGLDIGTASCKLTIVNLSGEIVRSISQPYPTFYLEPQRVEQDPDSWWKAIRKMLSECKKELARIRSIAISSHMESIVPIGKDGKPLRNCIVWSDQRGRTECGYIRKRLGEKVVHHITGCRIDPMHSGSKIMWIKENEETTYDKTRKFLSPKDYLNFLITGKITTDYSIASSSLLFDLKQKTWSNEILKSLSISIDKLPDPQPSTKIMGEVTRETADVTGLTAGIPVVAGGGDTPCSALGSGGQQFLDGIMYLGSSASLYSIIDLPKIDKKMRLITRCHVLDGLWTIGGGMSTAGLCLIWFRDVLSKAKKGTKKKLFEISLDRLFLEASKTKGQVDDLYFLPNMMGERNPHYRLGSKGAFIGLTLSDNISSISRAILEGVAMQLRSIYDAIVDVEVKPTSLYVIGGGAEHLAWIQILSDVFGRKLVVPEICSTEAIGAALLAGIGTGNISNLREFTRQIIHSRVTSPNRGAHITYERRYPKFLELGAQM